MAALFENALWLIKMATRVKHGNVLNGACLVKGLQALVIKIISLNWINVSKPMIHVKVHVSTSKLHYSLDSADSGSEDPV